MLFDNHAFKDNIDLYMKLLDDATGDNPALSGAERAKRFGALINAISRVSTTVTSDVYKRVAERLQLPGYAALVDGTPEDQRRYLMQFCSMIQNTQLANNAIDARLAGAEAAADGAAAAEAIETALWVAARGADVFLTLRAVLRSNHAQHWAAFVAALGGAVRVAGVVEGWEQRLELYLDAASSGVPGLQFVRATFPMVGEDAPLAILASLGGVALSGNFGSWQQFLAAVGGAQSYVQAFRSIDVEEWHRLRYLIGPSVERGDLAYVLTVLTPLRETAAPAGDLHPYAETLKLVATEAAQYGKLDIVYAIMDQARELDETPAEPGSDSDADSAYDDDGNPMMPSPYNVLSWVTCNAIGVLGDYEQVSETGWHRPVLRMPSVDGIVEIMGLLEPVEARIQAVKYVAEHAGDAATLTAVLTRLGPDRAPRFTCPDIKSHVHGSCPAMCDELTMPYTERLRILGALLDFYEPLGIEPAPYTMLRNPGGARVVVDDVSIANHLLLLATDTLPDPVDVPLLQFVIERYDAATDFSVMAMGFALPRLVRSGLVGPGA